MLPRLAPEELVQERYQEFAKQLSKTSYLGEINCQYSARLAVATDNSVYQRLPQLVLHPTSIADVQAITELSNKPEFSDIKFSARGGGTGTNGQSLTPGIVVDLSKHMNNILEIKLRESVQK